MHRPFALNLIFSLLTALGKSNTIQVFSEPEAIELPHSRTALLVLKDRLTPNGVLSLLDNDINSADSNWHSILANSSGTPIPAQTNVQALIPTHVMNASTFLAWFGSDAGGPHKLIGAHPEHYVEQEYHINGTTSVNIVETWGTLLTHYTLPDYGPGPKEPYMAALPDYPYQSVAKATLRDGTVIANIHNSVRDKADGSGIEAVLYGWLPDGVPDDVIEGLRGHQAIEFTNWFKFAYRDIITGAFEP